MADRRLEIDLRPFQIPEYAAHAAERATELDLMLGVASQAWAAANGAAHPEAAERLGLLAAEIRRLNATGRREQFWLHGMMLFGKLSADFARVPMKFWFTEESGYETADDLPWIAEIEDAMRAITRLVNPEDRLVDGNHPLMRSRFSVGADEGPVALPDPDAPTEPTFFRMG